MKSQKTSGRQSEIGATLVHGDGARTPINYVPAIEQPADWLFRHNGTLTHRSQCCCCYRAPKCCCCCYRAPKCCCCCRAIEPPPRSRPAGRGFTHMANPHMVNPRVGHSRIKSLTSYMRSLFKLFPEILPILTEYRVTFCLGLRYSN